MVLGELFIFKFELWGILDGLDILIDRGFGNALIQIGSFEVVTAIQWSFIRRSNSTLIWRILWLLSHILHWNVCYIPREENQEADSMTKLAHFGSQ